MPKDFSEDFLVSSEDYGSVLSKTVLPFLSACRRDRTLQGRDRFPLFCSVFNAESPVGTVLVLHGFTENTFKYSELIYSLLRNHFSVVAYDQRGHGRSGRVEKLPHPSVTHVSRFEDYVDDLEIVCDTLLLDLPKPWMIFAHSMGGAVASLFLERRHDVFSAAALCAPMIAPVTGVPAAVASSMAKVLSLRNRGRSNPFFMKPYAGPEDFESSCATDPVRFAWYDAQKATHQEYQNSVPSARWIAESVAVTKKILAAGAPESISCPVLLSTAEHDNSVLPEPQKLFIARVPAGRHLFVKDARHEIFRSVNKVFFPWWHEILSFFREVNA